MIEIGNRAIAVAQLLVARNHMIVLSSNVLDETLRKFWMETCALSDDRRGAPPEVLAGDLRVLDGLRDLEVSWISCDRALLENDRALVYRGRRWVQYP